MRELQDLETAIRVEYMAVGRYEHLLLLVDRLDLCKVQGLLEANLEEETETIGELESLTEEPSVQKMFTRLAG